MSHPQKSEPDLREALILSALLLAYSNGLTVWAQRRGHHPETLFQRLNPFLIPLMLAYAARRPGGLAAVGLHKEGLKGTLVGGTVVGLALSGPPLLFFFQPLLLDTPLEYGPIARLTRRELVVNVLVEVPIGIAVLEELAFRGLVFSALRRHLSAKWAIVGSAAAFAGWHLAVTATSAAESNLSDTVRLPRFLRPYLQPLAVVGGMLSTGVAGLAFGVLRERSGNLAGPILAHWLVDGIMISSLWLRRSKQDE